MLDTDLIKKLNWQIFKTILSKLAQESNIRPESWRIFKN